MVLPTVGPCGLSVSKPKSVVELPLFRALLMLGLLEVLLAFEIWNQKTWFFTLLLLVIVKMALKKISILVWCCWIKTKSLAIFFHFGDVCQLIRSICYVWMKLVAMVVVF